jgi:putative NADH-flavin reductase
MVTNVGPSKRLFVLGATGGTGQAIVAQALERGHRVTAFVRSPDKLGPPRDGLTVVRGDPLDQAALAAALPGHDGVLSALGPPGPRKTTISGDAARSTVAAMNATGLRRLLVVGVAVLFTDIGLLPAIIRRTFLRHVADDSAVMERIVTASDLDWTIVRPPRLTNGPRSRYSIADDALPPGAGANATVSRADVAHFMIEEVERAAHVRRIVGMALTKASARARDSGAGAARG